MKLPINGDRRATEELSQALETILSDTDEEEVLTPGNARDELSEMLAEQGREEGRPYRPSRAASSSDRRRLTEWSALTISSLKKSAPDRLLRSHFLCACSENKSVAYPVTILNCSAHCASSMAATAARHSSAILLSDIRSAQPPGW